MSTSRIRTAVFLSVGAAFLFAACADDSTPTAPATSSSAVQANGTQQARVNLQDIFDKASPAVLALPQTVYADLDEQTGKMVFGVENRGVTRGIQTAMARLGVSASEYEVKVTAPIVRMATLQSEWRPTRGGIQIHFGQYLCTLGFNADHDGGRSFITNSHCTNRQGGTEGTVYYQPLSSVNGTPIAVEVDDPDYKKGGRCPRGRQCRYSDASRALYEPGVETIGAIAKTTGANNGSLTTDGVFDITSQDDNSLTFSGTVNKIGRTTGWTSGSVIGTCMDVNVSGSNITQLCQTLVSAGVGPGDSGSPVFRQTGSNSAQLLGILWGGSSAGDLFVFSPLASIVDELGALDATTDGTGGTGGGGGSGGGGGDAPNCPPNSNKPACR